MRFTTLRTLMLVLAMVTQTFAGGFALARAAAISPEETLTAQCHQLRAGESSTPDDKTGRGHHCLSCLLCSEPPPAWVSVVNYQIVAPSDLALIGGSLLPFGGQNLIEAAACGCPVLVGPHTFNFAQAAEDAVVSGGALRVADGAGLAEAVTHLLTTPEDRINMKEKAIAFSQAHQGATARTMALIEPLLQRQR